MHRILPAIAAFVVASSVLPARAQTCTPFTDVGANDPFCTSIQWLFNRGVTLGCTAAQYCPAQFVRRDQMAAFMNRLADKTVFQQGGNAFGAGAILGTTDDRALEIHVHGSRAMRFEPDAISPNLIGGSPANIVGAGVRGATIGGGGIPPELAGYLNNVTDDFGTVAGGSGNQAGDDAGSTSDAAHATVGGGLDNFATGDRSTIAGGNAGFASGAFSSIAGGNINRATGTASTVAGGQDNLASGVFSFAAGQRAKATADGAFVWSDHRSFDFGTSTANSFHVRATGGIRFVAAIGAGSGAPLQYCDLAPGVVGWQCFSDRESKENYRPVDSRDVLDRLASMPLYSWTVRGIDDAPRMLGPTAQDFHAAFGLGGDRRMVATLNLDGVALAAIQGLNAKLEARNAALEQALQAHRRELAALRRQVAELARSRR